MDKISCSVGILTFNSAKNLQKCLYSVRNFEEIIICDGGSTDDTIQIANSFGAKIIIQDKLFKFDDNKISDFSGVRNQMLEAATKPWFLILDSDEYLSDSSEYELSSIIKQDNEKAAKVFLMPRKYEINGKIIDCAGTYPGYQLRFFYKNATDGFKRKIHEKIIIKSGILIQRLVNPIIVPISSNFVDLREKFAYYLKIDKPRIITLSNPELIQGMIHSFKSIILRWTNIARNIFFCKGKRMPLQFEIISTLYSFRMGIYMLLAIFKK